MYMICIWLYACVNMFCTIDTKVVPNVNSTWKELGQEKWTWCLRQRNILQWIASKSKSSMCRIAGESTLQFTVTGKSALVWWHHPFSSTLSSRFNPDGKQCQTVPNTCVIEVSTNWDSEYVLLHPCTERRTTLLQFHYPVSNMHLSACVFCFLSLIINVTMSETIATTALQNRFKILVSFIKTSACHAGSDCSAWKKQTENSEAQQTQQAAEKRFRTNVRTDPVTYLHNQTSPFSSVKYVYCPPTALLLRREEKQ